MAGLTSIETRPDGDGDMDHLTATATGAAGLASPAARWTIAFAWVMGVASGVLSAGALVLMEGPTGAVYLFDFASFLVALLIARGNPWHGAVGGAGMVLGGLAWGVSSGAPASVVGQLVALAVMSQVLGVLWRLVLRWVVRRERWHRSEAVQAQRDTAAARHATRLVEEELRQVRVIAQPILQRIAEGAPMSDDLRRDAAIVEGTVRDRLRAPAFRHPLLVEAIGRLRAQGADVTVVSPPGPGAGQRRAGCPDRVRPRRRGRAAVGPACHPRGRRRRADAAAGWDLARLLPRELPGPSQFGTAGQRKVVPMIRIGIVDDHPAMIVGASTILNLQPDMHVAAATPTVEALLDRTTDLDLVLLDLALADHPTPAQNLRLLDARGIPVLAYTSGEQAGLVQ